MIGDINDDGVFSEARFFQRDQNTAHVVINECDLAKGVGDNLAQLFIRLRRNAAVCFTDFRALLAAGGFRSQYSLVPPWTALEVAGAVFWQIHLGGIMQARPWFGRIKRMVRVGKADPCTERFCAAPVFQPVDCTVRCPCRIVPCSWQHGVPCLRGALCVPAIGPHRLHLFIAAPVGMKPALIMLPGGRLFGSPPIVPDQHQFNVLKPHVGAVPRIGIAVRRLETLRRASRLERVVGRKMRLTEIGCFIPCRGHCSSKPLLANRRIKVDAIVMHSVGAAKLTCQDGGARRLANHGRGDAIGETRAVCGQLIQMRGFDVAPFMAHAIGAVLVGRNQQDVRTSHKGALRRLRATTAKASTIKMAAIGCVKRKKGSPPVAANNWRAVSSRFLPRIKAIKNGRGTCQRGASHNPECQN